MYYHVLPSKIHQLHKTASNSKANFEGKATFRLVAFKTAVDLTQVAKAGFEEDAGTHSFHSQKYEKEEEKIQTSQIDPIKVAAVPGYLLFRSTLNKDISWSS